MTLVWDLTPGQLAAAQLVVLAVVVAALLAGLVEVLVVAAWVVVRVGSRVVQVCQDLWDGWTGRPPRGRTGRRWTT